MQDAGSLGPVEINLVPIRNHAEFPEVQMSISALQRIERPSHGVDAHAQGAFPLGQLKLVAQIQIAIFVAYGQHVGMHHYLPVFEAKKNESETKQLREI